MNTAKLFILLLVITASYVRSYNILGVLPYPGRSHVAAYLPMFEALALKGHNVTVISYFPRGEPLQNYTDIDLRGNLPQIANIVSIGEYNPESRMTRYLNPVNLQDLMRMTCDAGLQSEQFKDFMKTEMTFDVIVIEFFNSDCFLGLTRKFKAPIIGTSSCTLMPWSSERFGNPTHTAYIPNNFMPFSDRMSFLQRLENTIVNFFHLIQHTSVAMNEDEKYVQKYFGMSRLELIEKIYSSDLLLINTHFSLNLPRPLVPNIIEIGGIHIQEPQKLPKNLDKWISEAKDGVIYFSFGSLLKTHTLPTEKRNAFLRAFARLPQRVLWKWEDGDMENKPENVMVQKWLPQADILSHPNVKVFISHGGLLGTIEAVHYGVPIVVMPQFGDQHTNARAIEATGGGVVLSLSEATEATIFNTLQTVLSESFRHRAKMLSEKFRDRPMRPLDTAVYWVEYVARHKGAQHMRTAAAGMPFFQYYLLDVLGFIFATISVLLYILWRCTKSVLRLFRPNKKVKKS